MVMDQVRAGLGVGLYEGRCWLYRALFFHQCFWSVPSNSLAGSIFFPASQLTVLGVCTDLRGHTYISVPFSMRMEVSGR